MRTLNIAGEKYEENKYSSLPFLMFFFLIKNNHKSYDSRMTILKNNASKQKYNTYNVGFIYIYI